MKLVIENKPDSQQLLQHLLRAAADLAFMLVPSGRMNADGEPASATAVARWRTTKAALHLRRKHV